MKNLEFITDNHDVAQKGQSYFVFVNEEARTVLLPHTSAPLFFGTQD